MATTHDRPSGRHPVNIGHLVMGLALLGIVGVWALVQTDTVPGDDIRWLLPIPWVVAGAAGLAVTAVSGSRRYAVRQVGWVGEPARPGPVHIEDHQPSDQTDQTFQTDRTDDTDQHHQDPEENP